MNPRGRAVIPGPSRDQRSKQGRGLDLTAMIMVWVGGSLGAAAEDLAPFRYHQRLIFIEGRIRDETPLCLLDTGANVSAIDAALVDKLGLAKGRAVEVTGSDGVVSAEMVVLDQLELPGRTVGPIEATSRDLQHGATPDGRPLGLILGYHLLKDRALWVDYRNQKLAFAEPAPNCALWLDMELDRDIPRVRADLDGHETKLRIDTGASLFATKETYINLTARDEEALKTGKPNWNPIETLGGSGVGAEVTLRVFALKELHLGDLRIDRPRCIIQPKQGYFARDDAVGFFGNNLLEKHGPIVLDFLGLRLGFRCEPPLAK